MTLSGSVASVGGDVGNLRLVGLMKAEGFASAGRRGRAALEKS